MIRLPNCCGAKRIQARSPVPSYIKLQWQLHRGLFIEGAFTGNAYKFSGYGTTQNVDSRDKNVLFLEGMKKVT
jgi:hypothetical protein